jgi:hypothetical protein
MQLVSLASLKAWNAAYICGSNAFSLERALRAQFPELPLHSSDQRLVSSVIAALAAGTDVDFRFTGDLANWEDRLAGRPFLDRAAALLLANHLGRYYSGPSIYARKHRAHYEAGFEAAIEAPREHLRRAVDGLALAGYSVRSVEDHLAACAADGGGLIIADPATRKTLTMQARCWSGNVEWSAPGLAPWEPGQIEDILARADAAGVPFVAVTEQPVGDRPIAARYRFGADPVRYLVTSEPAARSSLIERAVQNDARPFKFEPVDIDKISKRTQVRLYPCTAGSADYVKGLFLQENIVFVRGMVNVLVYLDDMLAGVLTYNRMNRAMGDWKQQDAIYLLSDVSTTRFGRVSKLLPMLAASRQLVDFVGKRLTHRPVLQVLTTVRTNNPVSMKYRGIFDLIARKEAPPGETSGSRYIINYGAAPREQTPQQIFKEWLRLHFKDDRARKVTNSYAAPVADAN